MGAHKTTVAGACDPRCLRPCHCRHTTSRHPWPASPHPASTGTCRKCLKPSKKGRGSSRRAQSVTACPPLDRIFPHTASPAQRAGWEEGMVEALVEGRHREEQGTCWARAARLVGAAHAAPQPQRHAARGVVWEQGAAPVWRPGAAVCCGAAACWHARNCPFGALLRCPTRCRMRNCHHDPHTHTHHPTHTHPRHPPTPPPHPPPRTPLELLSHHRQSALGHVVG